MGAMEKAEHITKHIIDIKKEVHSYNFVMTYSSLKNFFGLKLGGGCQLFFSF